MNTELFNNLDRSLKQGLIVLITGASGAGKTTLLKSVEHILPSDRVSINYFCSIGVPDISEMIRKYGSGEKWQEAMTHFWLEKLLQIKDKDLIFLEGQFNPEFAVDYLRGHQFTNFLLFCLHVDQSLREDRLIQLRNQPELANPQMENWAKVLKKKTAELGGIVINANENQPDHIAIELINHVIAQIL